jgi:phytoene synthase
MTHSHAAIETSYADCRRICRRAGSNFHAGFRLLPEEKRRGMEALYAFMRHTDDLADDVVSPRPVGEMPVHVSPLPLGEGPGVRAEKGSGFRVQGSESQYPNPQSPIPNSSVTGPHPNPLPKGEGTFQSSSHLETSPADPRREALAAWREALEKALHEENDLHPSSLIPHPSSLNPSSLNPSFFNPSLLPALADTVHRFQIPHKHLVAVIDGVEMDLQPRHYETFDDLERYCELVASAVGMACIHIWGFRGPEAFEPARKVGVAMQLTNILRDLKEDAQAGRVYLPQQDLRDCGYSADNLSAGVVNEPFFRLMRLEIERAEHYYREGVELFDLLEPDGRRIFGLMTATYRALLRKIARQPDAVLRGRVRLGLPKRLQLAARWTLPPPRKAALK